MMLLPLILPSTREQLSGSQLLMPVTPAEPAQGQPPSVPLSQCNFGHSLRLQCRCTCHCLCDFLTGFGLCVPNSSCC